MDCYGQNADDFSVSTISTSGWHHVGELSKWPRHGCALRKHKYFFWEKKKSLMMSWMLQVELGDEDTACCLSVLIARVSADGTSSSPAPCLAFLWVLSAAPVPGAQQPGGVLGPHREVGACCVRAQSPLSPAGCVGVWQPRC